MATIGDIVAHLRMDNRDWTRKTRAARADTRLLAGSMRQTRMEGNGLTGCLQAMSGGLGSISAKAGAATTVVGGLTVAVAGTAAASYKAAESYNSLAQALQRSIAIQEVSIEQQQRMTDVSLVTARNVRASSEQIAESFFFLASAGLDVEQQIAAIPAVTAFAEAGNFDLARATDLATDAQSALGMSSKDAQQNLEQLTRVTDVLVGANTLANASTEQFSEALTNRSAAAARQIGMEIEELTAILAAFADQGVKGAEAGTQVAIVLRDLQTKALANQQAFAQAGVAVFDASGEFRDMADIISDLETRLDGLSDAEQKATLLALGFADKSVGALQTLLGTSEKIEDYEQRLLSMGGTSARVAADQMTDFSKATNRIAKEWDETWKRIGSVADNAVTPILENVAALTEGVAEFTAAVTTAEVAANGEAHQKRRAQLQRLIASQDRGPVLDGSAFAPQDDEPIKPPEPVPPVVLESWEQLGDTVGQQELAYRTASMRIGELNVALREGRIEQAAYDAATSANIEKLDQARGGAARYIRELERQIETVHMSADAARLYGLEQDGAAARDLERVDALQQVNRAEEARRDLQRELASLQEPDRNPLLELDLDVDQFAELNALRLEIEAVTKARDDAALAAQIADSVKTPADRIREEIAEAERLRQVLGEDVYSKRIAQLNEEWQAVNEQTERYQALLAGAAKASDAATFSAAFELASAAQAGDGEAIDGVDMVPPVMPSDPPTPAPDPPPQPAPLNDQVFDRRWLADMPPGFVPPEMPAPPVIEAPAPMVPAAAPALAPSAPPLAERGEPRATTPLKPQAGAPDMRPVIDELQAQTKTLPTQLDVLRDNSRRLQKLSEEEPI